MILRTRSILNCFAIFTLTFIMSACGSGGDSATNDNTDESVSVGDVTNSDGNDESTEINGDDSIADNEPAEIATDDSVDVAESESTEGSVPSDEGVEVTESESTEGSVPSDDGVEVTEIDSVGESVPADDVEITDGDSAAENVQDDDGADSTVNDSTGDPDTIGSSPRIELDGSIFLTTDTFERPHLFGILRNTGGSDAVFVKASCSFFSADSALVEERQSYVKGTNIVLTSIDSTTNTALKPGETGVFEVAPYIDSDEFSTFECKYSYDLANNTRDPDARMELVGTTNVQENYFGDVEYLGQVKNTGVKGLVFGKLYFVTRDTADSIVDVSLTYVNGDTVTLELIDTTTDTALKVGSTGTFSAHTNFPLSNYGQHSVMLAWDDSEITDDIARKSDQLHSQSKINTNEEGRTERVNSLRNAYLGKRPAN